ncbi:MAG: sugar kinase [Betaproteobacteria bacterium]|nr:sugar kinase [Betaproteobacteria bacterium]
MTEAGKVGKTLDFVSIGEPLVEFTQLPDQADRYLQGFGGDTMNAAIAAARQGAGAAFVSRVGDDRFGRLIRSLLEGEGVGTAGIAVDVDAPTGCYFVTHGPDGHHFHYLRGGSAASRLSPRNVPLALVQQSRFLHVSAITQAISVSACDAVFAAVAHARSHGVSVVYDPNLRLSLWPLSRAKAIVEVTARDSDYFLPSLDDARMLSGRTDPRDVLEWARGTGARHVALKLGADGAMLAESGSVDRIAGHKVECVDATGAGDCFAGSLVARLAAGDGFRDAVTYACVAAALSCTGYGAIAPIPDAARVRGALSCR